MAKLGYSVLNKYFQVIPSDTLLNYTCGKIATIYFKHTSTPQETD